MLSDEVDIRHVCFLSARSCCRRKWWGLGIFSTASSFAFVLASIFFPPPLQDRVYFLFEEKYFFFFLNGKSRVNISEEMDARPFSASGEFVVSLFGGRRTAAKRRTAGEHTGNGAPPFGVHYPLSLSNLHSKEEPLSVITTTPTLCIFDPLFSSPSLYFGMTELFKRMEGQNFFILFLVGIRIYIYP